jgi:hypothetical protein
MEVSPIRKYCGPSIPTHEDVENRPDLLQHIPTRWQTNPAVLTALASVTMLSATNLAIAGGEKAKAKPARVAPVFQHGEGRGTFGCVAISPPVCLSEDEARQIVNDEVKRAGLSFTAEPDMRSRKPGQFIDARDKKRNVSYVFVSMGDGITPSRSSVFHSSPLSQAKSLVKHLKHAETGQTIGVFYDPMTETAVKKNGEYDWKASRSGREERQKAATVTAKQQLRLQVQDFVKWLKAQGVI